MDIFAQETLAFLKRTDYLLWYVFLQLHWCIRHTMNHCQDRKKELIKYKGLQVAPAELEAVLTSHQHILDAGVIGVFDEQQSTEVPRAYVVADKSVISAKAIQDFVRSRLASHKQLRGGVEFVAAISKSPAGKILRKDLRALAMATNPAKAKL
jgi:acyl-coenzyme A synthetase/AMP-(fatty) acid ligase